MLLFLRNLILITCLSIKGQVTVTSMYVDKGEFACFDCVSGSIAKLSSNNGEAANRKRRKLTSFAILTLKQLVATVHLSWYVCINIFLVCVYLL